MAYLWVASLPTIAIRESIGISDENSLKSKLAWWIWYLCNCSLCSGFWIGLFSYENISQASIVAVLAETIHRLMIRINK
jgi:hypothetical protein